MKNKFPIIEFHILQSFPVSCLNRDDVGSPKQALIGGVERLRVSSQCWKRAVRLELHEQGVELGVRTKKVKEKLFEIMLKKGADELKSEKAAESMAKCLSDDSLLFMTESEYEKCADFALDNDWTEEESKEKKKKGKKSNGQSSLTKFLKTFEGLNAIDIALFGRMVAKAPEINIEAASAFSHAISTHESSSELDFFTALDDVDIADPEAAGAAHMGTLEFGSATYYRYVSLNVSKLAETMKIEDDFEALGKAIEAFVKALYVAVPAARKSTMSAACPWGFAKVLVRRGQRMQCAFEKPVRAKNRSGFLEPSIKALRAELSRQEKMSGSMYGKKAEFEIGEFAETISIDDLIHGIQEAVGVHD